MRMIHETGNAAVFEHEKVQYTPGPDGVYDIPDEVALFAIDAGFIEAPPPEPVAEAPEEELEPPPPPPEPVVPMKAPDDVTSVNHDGQEFVIPADRISHVPVAAVEAFIGMGFKMVEAEE